MIRRGLVVKGTCPVCNRRRLVRKDGLMRKHYEWEGIEDTGYGAENPLCPGSDQLPLQSGESGFCNIGCSGCRDIIKYGI